MYKISQTVRSTHNQDGAIVLDIREGQMFSVNLVGSRVLELLNSGTAQTLIVNTISKEFGAPRELVAGGIEEFMKALKALHLIENEGAATMN